MIGQLKSLLRLSGGEWLVSFTTREDPRGLFDELKEAPARIDIKKASKARSLNANAYAWVLIDRIAEKTGVRKSEVYRSAIREIGGVSDAVCVVDRAVERLVSGWEHQGLGWQTEIEDAKIDGCKRVTLYYGSSVFDSSQMRRFIDLLVQDAEGLGISTIPPKEYEDMLRRWGNGTKHSST